MVFKQFSMNFLPVCNCSDKQKVYCFGSNRF